MQRWKITIEFDGTAYVGWQKQNNGISVQQVLEKAATDFLNSDTPVEVHGAGRTDARVHALGMVAHFDADVERTPKQVMDGITQKMIVNDHAITVINAEPVDSDFHARFDATHRHYRYLICNRHAVPVINRNTVWHVRQPLDVEAMQAAANHLIGHHDFTSFRAVKCQADDPTRTISDIKVYRDGEIIAIDVSGISFLHHQVRNFVGTLKEVGEGERHPGEILEILEAKNREAAGITAPAHGLFLVQVDYDG